MTKDISIHWFRQDLRLSDNPALHLSAISKNVLPIFILDDENAGELAMGGASRWWLHHSLASLNESLGGALSLYRGNPMDILSDIISRYSVQAVYWNRCYENWQMRRDAKIKSWLKSKGIKAESANGFLLWEPWTIKKDDGTPYKVFTSFYRKGCLRALPPRAPLPACKNAEYHCDKSSSLDLSQLNLLTEHPWHKKLKPLWRAGEKGASACLQEFIKAGLSQYRIGRDFPAKPNVSKLSPYLHFGEISPNQLWHSVNGPGENQNADHFCSELGWREFSYSQLYYNPDLNKRNLQRKFDNFPWTENESLLNAWKKGLTGIPMVDAGMRELWQTGYMHNRVRMIAGSYLVKNLRLHWHHGERWFWDTLVDADLASNSANWQWVSGCGADAAPYFRIFNPVTQGQKFDPDGSYVRQYIPELASLPNKFLFNPWEAPEHMLDDAGVKLGTTYPKPILDLKETREAALRAFQSLKQDALQ